MVIEFSSLFSRLSAAQTTWFPASSLGIGHVFQSGEADQQFYIAEVPRTIQGFGDSPLFASHNGRDFYQLTVSPTHPFTREGAESPKRAILTRTPNFISMALVYDGLCLNVLFNDPADPERLQEVRTNRAMSGEIFRDAAFHLYSSGELPELEGALQRWWTENVWTMVDAVSLGTFVEFVHGIGHNLNNSSGIISPNVEALKKLLGNLTALPEGSPERMEIEEILADIDLGVRRVVDLTQGLQQRYQRADNPMTIRDPLEALKQIEARTRALQAQPKEAPKPVAPANPPVTEPLLILDDDRIVAASIVILLEMWGFSNLLVTHSADEALEVFESNPGLRVVLSDFNLGEGRTGLDVIREMRRRRPDIRVLMLTGQKYEVQKLLRENEPDEIGLLPKPADTKELESRLRALFEKP